MRMEMKMGAVSAISLLLLCSSAISSADSKDSCDLYTATGSDITVPMVFVLDPSYSLKWLHNDEVIFHRKRGKVLTMHSVSENGSLTLTNVKESNKGKYTSDLYDSEGKGKGTKDQRLCVIEPPPEPSVKVDCKEISEDKQLEFTCVANPDDDLRFEWLQNNMVLGKEKRLKKPVEQVKTSPIRCKVSNLASSMTSAPVTYTGHCDVKNPKSIFPDELWGINTWIFVGAGGGLVLILIILVIVCCICTKRRKHMRLKEEGELRLAWTNDKQHHSHPPDDHHHHHPHHPQQQPAGHTGPRQQRSRQQRPRGPDQPKAHPQPSPRRATQAPRPPGQIDEEQPPPLPQPRKNATKTQRV